MKKLKQIPLFLLATLLLLTVFTGCNNTEKDPEDTTFSYSDSLDENGFWEGVNALDYVTLFTYQPMVIPSDVHQITEDEVQEIVDAVMESYLEQNEITDRAVIDGDTVNIDFVGSVDGVEFSGGSTEGIGTDITIGVTNYIDDFLEQLIGHKPGETFNVEVTFPEDYGNEELNGKDAVFVTTINYIVEEVSPELTDSFVAEKLFEDYGWTTIDEMKETIYTELQKEAITAYIEDYLYYQVTVQTPPDSIITYIENSMIAYFEEMAGYYGMEFDEFLSAYAGVATVEELKELYYEYTIEQGKYYLVIQAIAEDANISVEEADITAYFETYVGTSDYSTYQEEYGLPYLKQTVLMQKVVDYLTEHAELG